MSAPVRTGGRVVIVGGGLAGLMTALKLAPEPCIVLSVAPFGAEASSAWAQGGIAAAVGPDDDPEQHLADTLAAGDGLYDPAAAAAARILRAGPAAIDGLARLGARLDSAPDGSYRLGREAAQGRHRIVHAAGDGTGREVLRAVLAAARAAPSISLMAGVEARRLLLADVRVAGLLAAGPHGALLLPTRRVVVATGGIAVLLDDMGPDLLARAVECVAGRAVTEASGRITPATAGAVAASGVDLVSIGWLTHSAPVLDIGLDHRARAGCVT